MRESTIKGECEDCGTMLKSVLPEHIAEKSYSMRYLKKEGYDGIQLGFRGDKLHPILCLECFNIAKKTEGFTAEEKTKEEYG